MTVILLDPYGQGRHLAILPGDMIDRAALGHCLAEHPGRQTWHLGALAGCAGCRQDARAAWWASAP